MWPGARPVKLMSKPNQTPREAERAKAAAVAARIREAGARARAEAEARRAAAENPAKQPPEAPVELGGRKGPEPTRFGDWEKKGIVSDF